MHVATGDNLAVPGRSHGTHISSASTLVNPSVLTDTGGFSFETLNDLDAPHQLEALRSQLSVAKAIKEGAENLLRLDLADGLRLEVRSELSMAENRIEAILQRIDIQTSRSTKTKPAASPSSSSSPPPPPPVLLAKRQATGRVPANLTIKDEFEDKDDFRTTLNHASSCIKELLALGRSTTAASPPSSSSSQLANGPDIDRQRLSLINVLVSSIQRNVRVQYELNIVEIVRAVIPALFDRSSKPCRAAAYRLLRHALVDSHSVILLSEQPIDWYIVKSLTGDNAYAVEKEQVIKLIRTIVEVGSTRNPSLGAGRYGKVHLSEPVVRAFIAVAEHAEDPFRLICVQTLVEILLIDIDLIARTGGLRFLLHALGEGPVDLAPILAAAFLHIIDCPGTRAYLRIGSDIEIVLSAVTDAYGKGPDHAERMRACTRVIQLMLRTWSGLMYFCTDNMQAIRSLIDTLRIPFLDTREIVLDMFFDLLNIKMPEWFKTFIEGRRLTSIKPVYHKPEETTSPQEPEERAPQTLKLTDQYLALLLLVFTNAGILDALVTMLKEAATGTNLSRKATLLVAEILEMANRVLPLSIAAKIQAVPGVFDLASDYTHGENRIVGTLALSAIDSFNRNRARLQPSVLRSSRPRANSTVEDAVRRGQRQVEQVKIKIGMQMDDKTFQASLLETQVMTTKDHSKWNFELLQELIEGPLLNPKRMEEVTKVSRFIRRLMSFFHPFQHRFSDLPKTTANLKWVKLGCTLLSTLISSTDGLRYISTEDILMQQLVDCFAQLDPFNSHHDSDPILSKRRVADTLTYGYLEMLGTLSKHKEGVELLEKFHIFTAFYHLSELRSREDLIKAIIENLDYNMDGHPRIVLSKALTSSYKHIRLYATQHLGELIRSSVTVNAWTLRLLLTQLYDPSSEVCETAVHFLEDACEAKEILQIVVELQPMMDHLGGTGHPLLLKFMSTQQGFRYLYDTGYIDLEMDEWFNDGSSNYVVQVEVFLSRVFNGPHTGELLTFDATVPPHFYGEMAKTELGCQVLHEKGHFADFAHFIRHHGNETEDGDVIMKLKSVLWAVGNVGATEGGLPFLEEEEIIPAILEIANTSAIPSVRGTCFFVLGLVASTSQGAEILDDFQWEATLSPLGLPTSLCVPVDIESFISIPPWETVPAEHTMSRLIPPTAQEELEVITAIQNLSNTVIANAASRSLAKMKSRPEYRHVFASPSMLYRALHTISTQRYRLPVRRYIMDLFDMELNVDVINSLAECAELLKAPHPSFKVANPIGHRASVFGRVPRPRADSESEEEEDEVPLNMAETKPVVVEAMPAISLRPVSRIAGFDMGR